MKTLTIGPNDAGQRLDKFLQKTLKHLPQSMLYKGIRTKKIKVNRKRAEIGQMLAAGDTVELFLPPDLLEEDKALPAFLKLTPKLDIVYEDAHILLLNKRAGLIVHSDAEEDTNTLISHVQAYLYRKGEYDPAAEQSFAPALVNRIDRNTGGIVIAAKTAEALRVLNQKVRDREMEKNYLCAAHGIFEKKEGLLTGWLTKDSDQNMVTVYKNRPRDPEARMIKTGYRVLKEKNGLSLLEIDLLTGRTHQIRAHLASVGHPLLGDGKYGINRADKAKGYKFQALYSQALTFRFTTDAGALEYLNGKRFEVDPAQIWFLEEFQ